MKTPVSSVLLYICLACATPASSQTTAISNQVKAAFILNFAKFVEWPPAAFRTATSFALCTSGDVPAGVIETTVRGETVGGRPIVVRRITSSTGVTGCHLLYVTGAGSGAMVEAAAGESILTVGESEDFIDRGGIIRFIEVARRVRFQINPSAAERSALRVHSRLLRLADIVDVRRPKG